jgi:hypothetical protein
MHHSRLCAVLIDCRNTDLGGAARFWGEALGRSVDLNHPSSRSNYRMLETPPDEPIVEIQRVDHESRVHCAWIELTRANLHRQIERDDVPVAVDFSGPLARSLPHDGTTIL